MAERDDTPEKAPTAEELELAARLRDDLAKDEVVCALRAAWSPPEIDPVEHEAIIERVLERTAATREELQKAAELRRALEDESIPSEEADLARSLKAAWMPAPVVEAEHEPIIERALDPPHAARPAPARRGVVVRIAFGASAALAMAAAFLLVLGRMSGQSAPSMSARAPELLPFRSTQELFDKPFERGSTSARIDRITVARAGDLRENRFAMWGVR
jgi:hypothetical protein